MNDKFVLLTEVYEENHASTSEKKTSKNLDENKIFLSRVNSFSLRKVLVNVNHITVLKDYSNFVDRLANEEVVRDWVESLHPQQGFTRVQMNSGPASTTSMTNIVVLGGLELTIKKILDLDK
tara:strand:- start:2699 stop:3064 length:366 start_codon:yes stop_codon:yes gene_type:complete